MKTTLNLQMARNLLLAAQGLDRVDTEPALKEDVVKIIRRMNMLQIDTIHVIARSPYLVLWSRLGDYQPAWLDEALVEKQIFEYWAHAMCFLPMEDYPLYRRWMLDAIQNKTWPMVWPIQWAQQNQQVIQRVCAHLEQNGTVRSAEFTNKDHPAGGWWNWKEEKNALESMFFTGEVMIARRQNFQRVYTLRQNIFPDWSDEVIPDSETAFRTFALRAVRALGVARPGWVADYFRQPQKSMPQKLMEYASQGLLMPVEVEGLGTAYVHPDHTDLLDQAFSDRLETNLTTLLSPFDPVVWDRKRSRELFQFDYTIECYTPQAERKFGYFTLPILHRGRLIGRLDPKVHRAQGIFEIKSLHLEENVIPDHLMIHSLAQAIRRLAQWHSASQVILRPSGSPDVIRSLQAHF